MKIINVVGARPNFMKIAPIIDEMGAFPEIESLLLHTGQHYDEVMSKIFFDDLGLPKPDIYLGVGSGSHAEQTAFTMLAFEKVLLEHRPDLIVVVGDVNSTLACSVTGVKLGIPVAHIEAGLRSFDREMPEEINRIVTDSISDFLFTTSRTANENLIREGIPGEKIFFVGNVMIDTLKKHHSHVQKLDTTAQYGLKSKEYALLTLHRASNVDDRYTLSALVDAFCEIQQEIPILFPAHPRTLQRIREFGLSEQFEVASNLQVIPPQGYFQFMNLMAESKFVLTDSGGIQEETTILNIPCLTIRENTERPITITEGTNIVVGVDPSKIITEAKRILAGDGKSSSIPELWDGRAAQRIVKILAEKWEKKN